MQYQIDSKTTDSAFGLSASAGLEQELLNLFDFKLENDISLQPQTTSQEFSLELSLMMMRKMDECATDVLPLDLASKSVEERPSIESFLTDPVRVPLHLGDIFSALQQIEIDEPMNADKNVSAQQKPALPPRTVDETVHKSPLPSPFMAIDLEAPRTPTTPIDSNINVDTSNLSWENFLNDDASPVINLKPIRLSISESLRSSSSLSKTVARSNSASSYPPPISKSKTVRFADDKDLSSDCNFADNESLDGGPENLNVSAKIAVGSFEDALASQDTKKIIMSPTIAQANQPEGVIITAPTTDSRGSSSKKRFSGIVMLTSMLEKMAKHQVKSPQQLSKKSHGSHEYSNSPLSRSNHQSRLKKPSTTFPAPSFHDRPLVSSSAPLVTANDLIPEPVLALSATTPPPAFPPRENEDPVEMDEAKETIQSKSFVSAVSKASFGMQANTPVLTKSSQTEADEKNISIESFAKIETLDTMCQTPPIQPPIMISESVQTEQELVINTQAQRVADNDDLETPNGLHFLSPSTLVASSPVQRTLSVDNVSSDSNSASSSSDETKTFEKNHRQQQMEIQYLQEENMRLLQELNAMKLIVTTSRSQTQQMSILKEAAEARFEQLARVAHRKLLRAMVEANDL